MPEFPSVILFDLDDTLIAAHGRQREAWARVVDGFAGSLGALDRPAAVAAIVAAADGIWGEPHSHAAWRMNVRAGRREIVRRAFAALAAGGHPVPKADIGEALADTFSDYRSSSLRLFPDAHATLDALRARGVKLALVTNGDATHQRAKVVRFDLAHRFDHIQIEGEHGFGKPEERAYRHALETLGAAPGDCWMVGDNLEWEVIAPQRLGIRGIWIDAYGDGVPDGHAARPDRIIRTLSELLA